jgi:hypothetical protein
MGQRKSEKFPGGLDFMTVFVAAIAQKHDFFFKK